MTDAEATGDWAWLGQERRQDTGCLTFARGATPDEIIAAFGMDPTSALTLPEAEARAELEPAGRPWVRTGRMGEWAFAIEEDWLEGVLTAEMPLSAESAVATVSWTAKPTHDLRYLSHGRLTTAFDLGLPWNRAGSDPDRFTDAMRRAGLDTERPDHEEYQARVQAQRARIAEALERGETPDVPDPVIAGLTVLTLALGIRLPEDVARGPLLTAQKDR